MKLTMNEITLSWTGFHKQDFVKGCNAKNARLSPFNPLTKFGDKLLTVYQSCNINLYILAAETRFLPEAEANERVASFIQ